MHDLHAQRLVHGREELSQLDRRAAQHRARARESFGRVLLLEPVVGHVVAEALDGQAGEPVRAQAAFLDHARRAGRPALPAAFARDLLNERDSVLVCRFATVAQYGKGDPLRARARGGSAGLQARLGAWVVSRPKVAATRVPFPSRSALALVAIQRRGACSVSPRFRRGGVACGVARAWVRTLGSVRRSLRTPAGSAARASGSRRRGRHRATRGRGAPRSGGTRSSWGRRSPVGAVGAQRDSRAALKQGRQRGVRSG